MERKFNFVYLTTNLINGKQYIGDHAVDNIDSDNYIGSGIYILNALNEYGRENFKREILEFFPTKQKAFDSQEKYINEYNTLVPNGYNISPQGGFKCKGMHSEETKQKMKGRIKSIEEIEKIRKARKGSKASAKAKENMCKTRREKRPTAGEKNGMYGSNLYEKMLQKYGKEIADIKYKEWKIKNGAKQRLRKTSEESKQKRLNTIKNKPKQTCKYCNKKIGITNYKRYHDENCKYNPNNTGKKLFLFKKQICQYCNREIALNNYKKYHGEKCKFKV